MMLFWGIIIHLEKKKRCELVRTCVKFNLWKKNTLRAGFEPARGDPIGFQVQRLNHSAIAADREAWVQNWFMRGCSRLARTAMAAAETGT